MEPFYLITFLVLAACTAVLEAKKASGTPKAYSSDKGFLTFRNNYILVYSLMMGAHSDLHLTNQLAIVQVRQLHCGTTFGT